jgi:hypothetical protein
MSEYDAFSPAAWEFIRQNLGTPSQTKEATNWIPDSLVGKGGYLYDSNMNASGNLSKIFSTVGSMAGGTAATGAAVAAAPMTLGASAVAAPVAGAAGGVAGGIAGHNIGDYIGQTWFGKLLDSHTGNGATGPNSGRQGATPMTWNEHVFNGAFGGLSAIGTGARAGISALSRTGASNVLRNDAFRAASPLNRNWANFFSQGFAGTPKTFTDQAAKDIFNNGWSQRILGTMSEGTKALAIPWRRGAGLGRNLWNSGRHITGNTAKNFFSWPALAMGGAGYMANAASAAGAGLGALTQSVLGNLDSKSGLLHKYFTPGFTRAAGASAGLPGAVSAQAAQVVQGDQKPKQ